MVKIPETVEELKELVRRYDNALIFDCMSDDEYELNKNKEWMAECELVIITSFMMLTEALWE